MLKRRTVEQYTAGLERILEDNSRVEGLVAQMLQLASMEQASSRDAPAIDLGELVEAVLEHLHPLAEERGILLNFSRPAKMQVQLSPEKAYALTSNLVMNAIQHTPSGEGVTVSLCKQRQDEVTLQVADTGYGISEDALPHIFERFYREDRSRSRDTGGTGLGLSICKSIVEAARGSIAIRSSPGGGTRVIVTFIAA